MIERLSEPARRLLMDAQAQAGRLGHGNVGTEHLVLAAVADTSFVSARALGALLGDIGSFRRALEAVLRPGLVSGAAPTAMSEEARKAVEASVRIAHDLGHDVVGTGHILLGALTDTTASWMPLAAALGVSRSAVEPEVASLADDERVPASNSVPGILTRSPAVSSFSNAASPAAVAPSAELDSLRREVAQLRLRVELLESQLQHQRTA